MMTNKNIKGTSADKPTNAHMFDYVKCEKCNIYNKCKYKNDANRTGCRCGVEDK